jgi:hypothetical protein
MDNAGQELLNEKYLKVIVPFHKQPESYVFRFETVISRVLHFI